MATIPLIQQGTLNRVRTSVVIPSYTNLSITSSYMGKNFAHLQPEGPLVDQVETATGIVNSPVPYVMMKCVVDILRTQSLAEAWLQQIQVNSVIGEVITHADTSAFSAITINNASVVEFDPGAFDGKDPVFRLTLRGVFYSNNTLWNLV